MEKTNLRIDPSACAECYSCQLICSPVYTGAFNPLRARIVIRPGEIRFTDDCVPTCSLCARYCAYGALVRAGTTVEFDPMRFSMGVTNPRGGHSAQGHSVSGIPLQPLGAR